jgi:hypothetical protein
MALRTSLRAARKSRSRVARIRVRANGTAMLLSTSMMVKATINSTSVKPRWRLRRGPVASGRAARRSGCMSAFPRKLARANGTTSSEV